MRQSGAGSNTVAILDFHDGAAGQIATWFEEATGYKIGCFVLEADSFAVDIAAVNKKRICKRTEFPFNNSFKGRPFIVSLNWVEELKKMGINKVLPLTPDNRLRFRQIKMCEENGIELVSAIHPTATIMKQATIEDGVWINANAYIGYKAEIQCGSLIETGAIIEHHNIVERCCEIDPRVVTGGFTTLRECCCIHIGATIINHIEIGHDAIIGAGAVVIDNIPECCTAVGVPAKVIKRASV